MATVMCVCTSAAAAQVPIEDDHESSANGVNMLERMGEWYANAVQWRDALVDKAHAMIDQTREISQIRTQWENRAVGELGQLGGAIPDWRDFANFCAVSVGGVTACSANTWLTDRYESVIASTVYTYAAPLFRTVTEVDSTVATVVAQSYGGSDALLRSFRNTVNESMTESYPFIDTLAKTGTNLATVSVSLNAILDSTMDTAVTGQSLSSGRARQFTAALTHAEASTEVELAQSEVKALELATIQAADHVGEYRRAKRTTHGLGFLW